MNQGHFIRAPLITIALLIAPVFRVASHLLPGAPLLLFRTLFFAQFMPAQGPMIEVCRSMNNPRKDYVVVGPSNTNPPLILYFSTRTTYLALRSILLRSCIYKII